MQNVKAPTISQNFKYRDNWRILQLSEQEVKNWRKMHRTHTVEIMEQCLGDAQELLGSAGIATIASAMFEARVDMFFTWVMRALSDKTRNARANGGVPVTEERVEPSSSGGD